MNKNWHLFSITFCFLLFAISLPLTAQPQRPMEVEDLFRIKRVGDPQLSPDGQWITYVVTEVDKQANRTNSDIWIMAFNGRDVKKLVSSPKHDRHPRWSPDGKWIVFESNRDESFQIYRVNVSSGETKQLTTISTEATQPIVSPDGRQIAFVSAVFPEFSDKPYKESDALNKQRMQEREKVKARVFTKLLYRHWDSWVDDKRQHIFVMPFDGGEPRNVTPGDRDAIPTSSTFSAGDDFAFSPDGTELAYTATPFPIREEAWRTNHDIYTVNLVTGLRRQITSNPAADAFPRYSPNGEYIAYRAQRRAGFEADRWELMLYDRRTGTTRSLTENFDSWVEAFTWTADSRKLYFDAEERGSRPLWSVSVYGNDVQKVVDNAVNGDVSVSADARLLVFTHQTMSQPVEIFAADGDGRNLRQLSITNNFLLSKIELTAPEYVWYVGSDGTRIQMWIVKPPRFNPNRRYPLVFWVHGGPQGAFMDSWSYRWNAQLWAAQGYVLALPNPRGSTGFGQKFLDEISRDWGGKVFDDLMQGLAYMERLSWIDTTRMAAAGASYGGYMMNWFQAQGVRKFKTIINHCGVFNFYSMYGTTEELWFDEWEHGIPWETPDFDKHSPHKFARNFNTPTMIIHNELDFRVPFSEGMQLFTTLQRRGVPSKMLYFPDEGHWVLKPQNSELWHKTVFEWLREYLR
jgi:dipeptidyl aminopeptidase/acylaminoacyl peptidase